MHPTDRADNHSTLFSHGFRPLFLLMGTYALIGPTIWLLTWSGLLPPAGGRIVPVWHGHDMLMGLASAAIGGFLLTAVPNWTTTRPVQGNALAALCLFWIAGRLLPNAHWASLVADSGYWILLGGLVALPIIGTRNQRNYKVLLALTALMLSDLLIHLGTIFQTLWLRQAVWAQLWLVLLLINLIGGRIIPAFTGNWLRQRSQQAPSPEALPAGFSRVDLAGGLLLALFAAGLVTRQPAWMTVPAGALAAALQLFRLYRWKPWKTLSDPLVWMLHLSWAWLAAGTGLWTLAELGSIPVSAAIHALGMGAIASMILSVASRATLGHTGRPLRSHPLLTSAIVLLSLASILRITATFTTGDAWLHASGMAWSLAFVLWLWRYSPLLVRPALDE